MCLLQCRVDWALTKFQRAVEWAEREGAWMEFDKSSVKVKMVELTARVRVFDKQWLMTPGDLQEGAGR